MCPLSLLVLRSGLVQAAGREGRRWRKRHARSRPRTRSRSWRTAGLTVLELAERLGNVSEACRRGGIDRTSFYDWKRRFQLEGLDGLKDLPPIARSHPMAAAPEVVARIEQLALMHPAYGGCNRIEALLALEGRR